MDPVSATLLIASTAATAAGSIAQGNAAAAAANANATVSAQNRDIALQQAGAREDAQRRRAHYALGSQAAAIAESGVDPGSGSAARAIAESATNAELDALNVRYEGLMQARGYDTQAMFERARAKQARNAGYYGAVTSILGGASKAYGMSSGGGGGGGGRSPSGSRDYW